MHVSKFTRNGILCGTADVISVKWIYISFDLELSVASSSVDPSSVDLEKVANIIMDQSLKDCVFSKEAGRICYAITQVRDRIVLLLRISKKFNAIFHIQLRYTLDSVCQYSALFHAYEWVACCPHFQFEIDLYNVI